MCVFHYRSDICSAPAQDNSNVFNRLIIGQKGVARVRTFRVLGFINTRLEALISDGGAVSIPAHA